MMILACKWCEDVARIQEEPRWCKCTRSSGVKLGGDKVAVTGPCEVFEGDYIVSLQIDGALVPTTDSRVKRGRFSAPRLPKYPNYLLDNDE